MGGIYRHRKLLYELVQRDFVARYRGSWLGSGWNLLFPVIAVVVYTFVFGQVMKVRWPGLEYSTFQFGLLIFAGLSLHQAFQEMLFRAPSAFLSQPSLVKKVVFPLEILPLVSLLSSLLTLSISLGIVVLGIGFTQGLSVQVLWLPIFIGLMCFFLAGLGWLLASLGTFWRDVTPIISASAPLLLFLTPVFYPLSKTGKAGYLLAANPMACVIENTRLVLAGEAPNTLLLSWLAVSSLLVFVLGYALFRRTRPYFADVV